MNGKVYTKPGEKEFAIFRDWLGGEAAPPPAPTPQAQQTATSNGNHNTNGSGHRAQNGQSAPGHRTDLTPFHVEGCRVVCHAMNVDKRETKNAPKNEFRVVKMNGAIGTQFLVYCWHKSQFDALDAAKDKALQFEFETDADNKYINVLNVLAVGDQEYRDGKPYNEPAQQQELVGMAASTEITDDDIPF
jgi:hypothetical protein